MNINESPPLQPPIPGMPASFIPRQNVSPGKHEPRKRLKNAALIAAFAILAAAVAVAFYLGVQARDTLTAQNKHLQSQVTALQARQSRDYTTVSGEITDLGQMLLPYATAHCSTDLTGPHGPAEYWFNCTAHNPQTSSQPSG